MTVLFTSDTHFGDHRPLNIGKRPFASVAEMDAALIANWNALVDGTTRSGIWAMSRAAPMMCPRCSRG